jgi:predicted XRE-type DNA-binding protein
VAKANKTVKKLHAGDRGSIDGTEFEVGSGNVFADLGLKNPDERLAKARLAGQINEIIENNGWNQSAAAKKLGTHQPVISDLKRGRLRSITYDRLVTWLVTLGYSVEIKVERSREPHVEVAIAV